MPWPIIGHDWAVTLLRQSLAAGRVSHAYLFSGPPQVGKASLARTLAQALNCTLPDPPCGRCPACLKVVHNTHPDVQVIVGKGTTGSIQIDQVRALQREVALAPYMGCYRVAILRQMDRATPEAANSLLKTLEEPPSHLVLILTATHREWQPSKAGHRAGLPPTIVSRCQCLDLRPVARSAIEVALRERGVAADQAHLLAQLSGGRVGWAISASQDGVLLRQRGQDLDQFCELLSAGRVERLDAAWKLSRDVPAARRQVDLWAGWWRDVLLSCAGNRHHAVNVDQIERLATLTGGLSLEQAWKVLRALQASAEQLEDNVNPRLALEGALLKLPHLRSGTPDWV